MTCFVATTICNTFDTVNTVMRSSLKLSRLVCVYFSVLFTVNLLAADDTLNPVARMLQTFKRLEHVEIRGSIVTVQRDHCRCTVTL